MSMTSTIALQVVLATATASFLPGCSPSDALADSKKTAGQPPLPTVTVAAPLVMHLTDVSEYTGRASAVETVDVRAQATGYLLRIGFKEGDVVKKGQLLFVVDPRPSNAALLHAKADLTRSRADQALGQRQTARAERLFLSKSIAERERDDQASALEVTNAQILIAEAAVTSAQLGVDYSYVRSPIQGRIGRILVTVGNLVSPTLTTPLATIRSVDPLYVYVDVDEGHAFQLANAEARVGFPGEDGRPHVGKVDFVDTHVDPDTGTLQVRVVVPNADGKLTPGLFARVALPEADPADEVLVVDSALATDQDKKFVWTVDEAGVVHYRRVTPGPLHGNLRVIRDGVGPSDRVVIRGLQRLRPAAKVNPETAPMSDENDAGAP